jgi:predicted nucleic acid-binding Zn ribbon protein
MSFFRPKFLPPRGPGRSNPRRRALAAWRGFDAAPLEVERRPSAKAAGTVLPRVLSDLRIDNRRAEAEVVKVWNSLLDPAVVQHAQPVGLRKGTLFVNVDSSVWLAEIVRYRRKEILDRLQHSFGRDLIAKISYRIG